MLSDNPIMDSALFLKKQEICADINMAYEWCKKELGDEFDEKMVEVAKSIIDCARELDSSFFAATWLMSMSSDEDGEVEHGSRYIKAGLAWLIFGIYDSKWDEIDEKKRPFLFDVLNYYEK